MMRYKIKSPRDGTVPQVDVGEVHLCGNSNAPEVTPV